ncbi:flagellar hook-associated family protein [Sinorhizobium numidicum]|uniref:Flagellin n=1 Tax=Sinorhizobium numidicum TaxID=680248 RepID=A0ABY8D1E5_9HYPH|nr:flagellar hook-associated family protein [Sinorhizobium numidicum]WEX78045.1 flagellar hook-associated family protein [Sinorhizobium numidicum]WEX84704.1 flagellar hook-associated family protein [Sinorhizobium numidicum]
MKTSFVSNLAVQNAMRLTIQQQQAEMLDLQKELTTGRHADVGVTLGAATSRSLNLQRELVRLNALTSTNSIVNQRLSASQEALETMSSAAQKVRDTLVTFKGNDSADKLAIQKTEIDSALSLFTAAANTSFNGEFLFSGINSDVKPLADYNSAVPSAAKTAFNTALSTFMAAQVPPLTAMDQFSVTQMNDFITTVVEPMYTGADWDTDWSDASNQNMTSRISTTEVIESSTNVNTKGVRMFALASVIASELMDTGVTSQVRTAIGEAAFQYVEQGITDIDAQRSALGVAEARVKKANDSLAAQTKLIATHIGDIEGIDEEAASTRINLLKTQLETSYTLTSRIQQLSLLNYL